MLEALPGRARPAVSSSAWGSPGPWPPTPPVLLMDEPFGAGGPDRAELASSTSSSTSRPRCSAPSSSSRTTSTRRWRWATRWRCSTSAASSSSTPPPTSSSPPRPTTSWRRSSARSEASSASPLATVGGLDLRGRCVERCGRRHRRRPPRAGLHRQQLAGPRGRRTLRRMGDRGRGDRRRLARPDSVPRAPAARVRGESTLREALEVILTQRTPTAVVEDDDGRFRGLVELSKPSARGWPGDPAPVAGPRRALAAVAAIVLAVHRVQQPEPRHGGHEPDHPVGVGVPGGPRPATSLWAATLQHPCSSR